MAPSRRALAWSLSYVALVALCIAPILLEAGKFAGVYAMVVTLPWSIILFAALLLAELWFGVTVFNNDAGGLGLLLVSASLNTAFIYRIVHNRARVHR